ncbi:DegT/DnrJ/EryC1/StrS family aminotransferase [Methanolobus psychrotolerans]|uniref:DegT/DnrJ/EryC1/StrS family aminotransferase n=1 Tax=Methanolobus psychrotolerans TaxID=1874706 RepID=UPI000B91CD6A|nr:DegT/DnrJ/EryC1/StrS family aminotransferase [Methanolobus psychrotolerans]
MPGYELFGEEEKNAALELFNLNGGVLFAHGFDPLRKGVYKVREFENVISSKVKSNHCQVVSSGSAALLVAIKALGVQKGDEVITQSFTFVATVEAIIEAGAIPVITEVDTSLNMDLKDLERKITERTRLILPVHMAGAPADMDGIISISNKYNIPVLEDSAQCFGGSFKGKPTGTIGNAGIYSFDFAKNITTGEGGAIVTNEIDVFNRSRALHDHGHEYNPNFPRGKDTRSSPGFNYRMTEIQAAIGIAQMNKLDLIISKQRENKNRVKESIKDLGLEFRVIHDPVGDIGDTLVFFLPKKDIAERFVSMLYEKGLGTKNLPDALQWHFAGTWDHLFKEFPHLQNCSQLWPASRLLLERAIALPINVKMSETDINHVIDSVCEISSKLL